MIEQISPAAATFLPGPSPTLPVSAVYDAKAQTMSYNGGNPGQPLTVSIAEPAVVVVTLTTVNGEAAAFASFNFGNAWSDQLTISFVGPTELQITVPQGLAGDYTFTPQINAPVQKPGSITLSVDLPGLVEPPEPPNPQTITAYFDPKTGVLSYDPEEVTIPENQHATILLVSGTPGLTFYGFLPNLVDKDEISAWAPEMTVGVAVSSITINDPNLNGPSPINGTYGFALSYSYTPPANAGLAQSGSTNPDPTIFNEPIIG
jgi:hypothetical protein